MKTVYFLLLFLSISLFATTPVVAQTDIPLRADYGLIKVEELLKQGKYSEALNETTVVLQRRQRDADAYTYRGYAYYKLSQKDQALECFKTALMLQPTHLGANKYLATMYLDAGDIARALEQLQAMRIICGQNYCGEIDMLQREIDAKKPQQ